VSASYLSTACSVVKATVVAFQSFVNEVAPAWGWPVADGLTLVPKSPDEVCRVMHLVL
jgi:hypothetical protein